MLDWKFSFAFATADIRELALNPSDQYYASPLENDMFEWHFTIRGAEGTDFEGGIYHGRILLPPEYPYKPPHIVFLTPSGRFETNTKVCLSFSAFHPELWQPAWGIRLILEALISFLPTPGDGAIGALDYKPEERRKLAKKSQSFVCPTCGPICKLLPKLDPNRKKAKSEAGPFSKAIAELQRLQQEREGGKNKQNTNASTSSQKTEKSIDGASKTASKDSESKTETIAGDCTEPMAEVPELIPSSDMKEKNNQTTSVTKTETSEETIPPVESNTVTANENTNTNSNFEEASESIDVAIDGMAEDTDAETTPANDISKLYDPLLNISILLMLCICILLWKKFLDLSRELDELRSTPMVDTFIEKAASAASSVAASATTSEEL